MGKDGHIYKIEVDVIQTSNFRKYGYSGVKAVFRVIREISDGEFEEVILIDNHLPLGFHYHDELPGNHDSREVICASDYLEAWDIFDEKVKELFYEA